MFTSLALFARDAVTREGFEDAAERAELVVVSLSPTASSVVSASGPATAFRAPGGLIAGALNAGADIRLGGPTPDWFVRLDQDITGRRWALIQPAQALRMVDAAPRLVKLADGKNPALPARLYDPGSLRRSLEALGDPPDLQLLTTDTWLSIESEYRIFTVSRRAVTCSPYRVEDEPWSPLLHTHRASFHAEALVWLQNVLESLPDAQVPPAAAMDVARLSDGRLVLLEANQCWGAGLYGCDPHRALEAVLAANAPTDPRWLWQPDPALTR